MKDLSKRTAVIVLNWNKPEMTIECLESLQIMDGEYDIFVIDNGSDKDKRDKLIDEMKKRNATILTEDHINEFTLDERDDQLLLLMLLNQNYGYAKGNNYGLRLAHGLGYKYSLISNNDVKIIDRNVLVELIKGIENDSQIAIVGPKIIDTRGRIQGPFRRDSVLSLTISRVFFPIVFKVKKGIWRKVNNYTAQFVYRLMGAFMLVNNKIIQRVDFFDEKTFLYYEEAILSEKLVQSDFKILFYPGVMVEHNQSTTVAVAYSIRKSQNILLESERYYFKNYRKIRSLKYSILLVGQFFWISVWIPLLELRIRLKKRRANNG